MFKTKRMWLVYQKASLRPELPSYSSGYYLKICLILTEVNTTPEVLAQCCRNKEKSRSY